MKNTRFDMQARSLLVLSLVGLALLGGCRHKPVYPEVGSVYISTDPPKAEVLIDGSLTHRVTPVKLDGIPTGYHVFTLRINNYQAVIFSLEVKPGQTRMVFKDFSPIALLRKDTLNITAGDMCFSGEPGEVFISNNCDKTLTMIRVDAAGQISETGRIDVGRPQRLIAASRSANRIFMTKIKPDTSEELSGFELVSGKLVRDIYLNDIKYFSALIFSPDGNILIAADSLNQRLILIDSRLCSVIRTISTAGCPTDLSFDRGDPTRIYVTLSGTDLFALIDLETGAVLNSMTTGISPGAIFWDREFTQVGFSSRSDLTYTIVNKNTWTSASSARDLAGHFVCSACWSSRSDYILWAMDYMLGTLYVPDWQQTSKIFNGSSLVSYKLIKLLLYDDKLLLMLNAGQLVVVKLEL